MALSTSNVKVSVHILHNHFRVVVGGGQGHDYLDYAGGQNWSKVDQVICPCSLKGRVQSKRIVLLTLSSSRCEETMKIQEGAGGKKGQRLEINKGVL